LPYSRFSARALETEERIAQHAAASFADGATASSVRRVLATLAAGAFVALLVLGLGIYVARENSSRHITELSADRWSEILAGLIGQDADPAHFDARSVPSGPIRLILDRMMQDGIFGGYRITTNDGVVIASDKPSEIGHLLSGPTVATALQGSAYRKKVDNLNGAPLPHGTVAAYRRILTPEGTSLGMVGIVINRRTITDSFFESIWTGYGVVVALTLIFGGAGMVFLRRHLLGRHRLQSQLVSTLVDLELAEEVALIGYWSVDPKTMTAMWSNQMYTLFGQNPATFRPTGDYLLNAMPPDDRERMAAEVQRVFSEHGAADLEVRIIRADGTTRDMMVAIRCQVNGDSVTRLFGIMADITERKEAQRSLEKREQELAQAIAATAAAVWTWELANDKFQASPQLAQILGCSHAVLPTTGQAFHALRHPDDNELEATAFRVHMLDRTPYDIEYRVRHENGGYIWLHSRGRITEWIGDKPARVVGTIVDITRRRVAEEALRNSQQTLGIALRAAEAGYFTIDYRTDEFVWSPRFLEILGITDPAFRPSQAMFDELVHPDDSYMDGIDRERTRVTGLAEFEVRIRHRRGHYIWIHVRTALDLSPNGDPVRAIGFVQDVTARREANEALAISEERFRLLTEKARDIISLRDENAVITYISPSVTEITGYTPDELIGTMGEALRHPDEMLMAPQTPDVIVATGHQRQRFRVRRKNGETAWLEGDNTVVPGPKGTKQTLTSIRDITDSIAAEEALKESEKRFRLLTDNAADVIATYDEHFIVRYVSPSVERLMGYQPEELIGRRADIFLPEDSIPPNHFPSADPGKPAPNGTYTVRLRRKDNTPIWVETTIHTVMKPGGGFDVNTATRDVSDRVERERELRATRDRFQKQAQELATLAKNLAFERERAEKANAAKSQFLAMMSHELRTPMTGVLGMADLLLESNLNSAQGNLVHRLIRSARVLLDLLNDVLDFSKIEAEQLQIDIASFRISDIIADIESLFAPMAVEKGVVLKVDLVPVLHDTVLGDAKRLRQIFVNLVGNAIKFTDSGTIQVTVTQRETAEGRLLLQGEVTDSGIGISTDKISRLFQPFVQADPSTSRKYGGTGLGLAITKRLVEAMGGNISVTSAPGRGSTFLFTVLHERDPDAADVPSARRTRAYRDTASAPSGHGRRVLVAEDNDTTRFLMTTMLAKWGYRVDAVENGALAVEAFEPGKYDLILMDMQMPVMDGPTAISLIRSHEKGGQRVPVIAVTADLVSAHQRSFVAAGADTVVAKPVDWNNLIAEMTHLVGPTGTGGDGTGNDTAEAAATAQTVPSIPSADVLNVNTLAELRDVLGPDALAGMVDRFLESSAKYRGDIVGNVNAGKLQDAKRSAHALKGLSAQFGAVELAAVAKAIEERSSSIAEISALLPQLEVSATRTRAALAAYFGKALDPVS
jgi:PAS domain S-box-containing protein